MSAQRLDGRACAADVEASLTPRFQSLKDDGFQPHLAVVIVGDDPASHVYVNAKIKTCERLGIRSTHVRLPSDTDEHVLRQHINAFNDEEGLHGILIQSPLPDHMDEEAITDMIHPTKDVDGFHPENLGRLVQGRLDGMLPCTPSGVMRLLDWANIDLVGKHAGCWDAQGRRHASVVVARRPWSGRHGHHRPFKDGGHQVVVRKCRCDCCRSRPPVRWSASSWVKPGAVVVDVGINRVDDDERERGWRLAGDVDPAVQEVASWLSPVPGGVGPMTIAMLMENTVRSAVNSP